jgi:formylmethanofuran dehydrogenase subunit E
MYLFRTTTVGPGGRFRRSPGGGFRRRGLNSDVLARPNFRAAASIHKKWLLWPGTCWHNKGQSLHIQPQARKKPEESVWRDMNIGPYSVEDFLKRIEALHGYAAPGVLAGGYLTAKARGALPPDCLFEAVCETAKCLPDAVQLMSVCSFGSGRLWLRDSGRYAVTLFDKCTFEGVRAHIDLEALRNFPEYAAWFLKTKPKREQDSARLTAEIILAGEDVCAAERVRVDRAALARTSLGPVAVCPVCGEAFPLKDGAVCLACRGELDYLSPSRKQRSPTAPADGGLLGFSAL